MGFGVSVDRVPEYPYVCLLLPFNLPSFRDAALFFQARPVSQNDLDGGRISDPLPVVRKGKIQSATKVFCIADWRKKSGCETVTRAAVSHTIRTNDSPDLLSMQDNVQNGELIWKKPLALTTRNGPRNDQSRTAIHRAGFHPIRASPLTTPVDRSTCGKVDCMRNSSRWG